MFRLEGAIGLYGVNLDCFIVFAIGRGQFFSVTLDGRVVGGILVLVLVYVGSVTKSAVSPT